MRKLTNLIEELTNAKDTGYILYKWVCDYQQSTGLNKALRNIKPTYVKITLAPEYLIALEKFQNQEISLWTLYEAQDYTVFPIKNGTVGKKEVSWYGNHSGDDGLYFFDTEKECNDTYNDLIYQVILNLEEEKKKVVAKFNGQIETLKESFIGSDYIMEKIRR